MLRKKSMAWLLVAVTTMSWSLGAAAASSSHYPNHPVKIVVPFGSGGSSDVYARQLAQKLQQKLGQSFFVENRPGAGGVIGTETVARSAPDGYTLLVIANTQPINETLLKNKPYQLLRDFVPVAPINESSLVLVTNDKFKVKTVDDIIKLAKSEPGKLNYASSGVGTPYHLAGELFKSMAGINVTHVPYKSSGEARTGVVGGQVDYMFDAIATMIGHISSGRVHAIATTGSKRSPLLPQTPTMDESGMKGYIANIWIGVLAPKGTPVDIVENLNKAISSIVDAPETRTAWAKDGFDPMVMSTSEFKSFIEDEIQRLGKIVKDAHITVE